AEVGVEGSVVGQPPHELLGGRQVVDGRDVTAGQAGEVEVAVLGDVVVGDPGRLVVVGEVAEPLEHVGRAVDGRAVDRGIFGGDRAVDGVGGDVPGQAGDLLDDEPPGPGHPVPPTP